jgi:hypothetical protein
MIAYCRKARNARGASRELVLGRVKATIDRCRWALVTERLSKRVSTSDFFHRDASPTCTHLPLHPPLESRMREIRQSGSEGGGGREASPYP